MRFLSLSNVLAFCLSIGDVLNRRFWYVVCVNAFLYAMDLLFLEGGVHTTLLATISLKISLKMACYVSVYFIFVGFFLLVFFWSIFSLFCFFS